MTIRDIAFIAAAVAGLALLSHGCRSYGEFALPPPAGDGPVAYFEWRTNPEPVLPRGVAADWDGVDVLNPSVQNARGIYHNLYSGYDGKTWHTGLATSTDGIVWTKYGKVLSPDPSTWEGDYIAANGTLLATSTGFLYWYQAGRPPRIGLAKSTDTRQWTKLPRPVLPLGPRGSWDERGVADPYVIRAGQTFYMYYLGQDRARRQRLGVARSADGVNWQKLRANPVLEPGEPGAFDENGLGEPAVWASHGAYWMLYTGRDRSEHRRIGLARSANGVGWVRVPEMVFSGTEGWNSKVVCDPAVEVDGGVLRVWFGGGDVASPDENLHGQIGFALLEPIGANLSK